MRRWKHTIVCLAATVAAAMVFGFIIFANHTTKVRISPLPHAQAIVALTGGTQRIRAAGQLLKARHAKRLLISGVHRSVNRSKLRRLLDIDDRLLACCVDVDYAAQNTHGNAVETRKWARKHSFESIIVVTSSYHMPRSLNELGHMLPEVDLVAYPVVPNRFRGKPWWLDRHSVKLLGAEYLKYLPSVAQLGIGRIMETLRSGERDSVFHKAVAIQ
jgi:uncharacterized SAM-binding protein YcdF (DUF218 family)